MEDRPLTADDPDRAGLRVKLLSSHDGLRHLVRLELHPPGVSLIPADARRIAAALVRAADDATHRRGIT
jgi:hypothetical protein